MKTLVRAVSVLRPIWVSAKDGMLKDGGARMSGSHKSDDRRTNVIRVWSKRCFSLLPPLRLLPSASGLSRAVSFLLIARVLSAHLL